MSHLERDQSVIPGGPARRIQCLKVRSADSGLWQSGYQRGQPGCNKLWCRAGSDWPWWGLGVFGFRRQPKM